MNKVDLKYFLLIVFLIFALGISPATLNAKVIYVNSKTAHSTQNGTSWENAYKSLTDGLNASQPGDSIWIAAGEYYPTLTNARAHSFILKRGVSIFGGFNGNENNFNQRNFDLNKSILSGNIGNTTLNTDNTYNLLKVFEPDEKTIIDGIHLYNSYAFEDTLQGTLAGNSGGAISILGTNSISSVVNISNCTFKNNEAYTYGAAIYINYKSLPRQVKISNCVFESNKGSFGSAIYFDEVTSLEVVEIRNCLFSKNFVRYDGVTSFKFSNNNSKLTISDCQYLSDTALTAVSGHELHIQNTLFPIDILIENSKFSPLTPYSISPIYLSNQSYEGKDTILITNCEFKNYAANVGLNTRASNLPASKNGSVVHVSKSIFTGSSFFSNYPSVVISNTIFNNRRYLNPVLQLSFEGILSNCTFHNSFNRFIPGVSITYPSLVLGNGIITNCIFSGLRSEGVNTLMISSKLNSAITISNNLFELNNVDSIKPRPYFENGIPLLPVIGYSSLVLENNNIFNQAPEYENIALNDYYLKNCSVGVDQGNNFLQDSLSIYVDLLNRNRKVGLSTDIGALENQRKSNIRIITPKDACDLTSSGSIQLDFISPPTKWYWKNNLDSGSSIVNLKPGLYSLYSYSENCIDSSTFSIGKSGNINMILHIQLPSPHLNNGVIEINSVSGGVAPYHFSWENQDTNRVRMLLSEGTYKLKIRDQAGCQIDSTIVLNSSSTNNNNFRLYPTLLMDTREINLEIVSESEGISFFYLYDVSGKRINKYKVVYVQGINKYKFEIPDIPGNYVALLVTTYQNTSVWKITKI